MAIKKTTLVNMGLGASIGSVLWFCGVYFYTLKFWYLSIPIHILIMVYRWAIEDEMKSRGEVVETKSDKLLPDFSRWAPEPNSWMELPEASVKKTVHEIHSARCPCKKCRKQLKEDREWYGRRHRPTEQSIFYKV